MIKPVDGNRIAYLQQKIAAGREKQLQDGAQALRLSRPGKAATDLKYMDPQRAASLISLIGLQETSTSDYGRKYYVVDELFATMQQHGSIKQMARLLRQLALDFPQFAAPLVRRLHFENTGGACINAALRFLSPSEATDLLSVLATEANGYDLIAQILADFPDEKTSQITAGLQSLVSKNGNPTFRTIPGTALPRLRGVGPISSFPFVKDTGPIITKLFKARGIEIGEIQLDGLARLMLLTMKPSLDKRVDAGKTIEEIFNALELSLFITKDNALYVLGDSQNIDLFNPPSRTKDRAAETLKTAKLDPRTREADRLPNLREEAESITAESLWQAVQGIKDFDPLFSKEFKAGPYTIKITDTDPAKFTFTIADVPVIFHNLVLENSYDTTCAITAVIKKDGLILTFPDESSSPARRNSLFDPLDENVSGEWYIRNIPFLIPGGAAPPSLPSPAAKHTFSGLNLRQVTKALMKVVEENSISTNLPPMTPAVYIGASLPIIETILNLEMLAEELSRDSFPVKRDPFSYFQPLFLDRCVHQPCLQLRVWLSKPDSPLSSQEKELLGSAVDRMLEIFKANQKGTPTTPQEFGAPLATIIEILGKMGTAERAQSIVSKTSPLAQSLIQLKILTPEEVSDFLSTQGIAAGPEKSTTLFIGPQKLEKIRNLSAQKEIATYLKLLRDQLTDLKNVEPLIEPGADEYTDSTGPKWTLNLPQALRIDKLAPKFKMEPKVLFEIETLLRQITFFKGVPGKWDSESARSVASSKVRISAVATEWQPQIIQKLDALIERISGEKADEPVAPVKVERLADSAAPNPLWEAVQGIKDFGPLFNKEFRAGPYTVVITNPNPKQFTFEIKDVVTVKVETDYVVGRQPFKPAICKALGNGIEISLPDKENMIYSPIEENISLEWNKSREFSEDYPFNRTDTYTLANLNLRLITEALLKVIEETQK